MTTIIAKNQTGSPLQLTQLVAPDRQIPTGVSGVALTDYNSVNEIQNDEELLFYIENDQILLNDGDTDLTKEESLNYASEVVSTDNGDDVDLGLYLDLSGSNAMTGDLNMGSQDIVAVGQVDGRNISLDGAKLDTVEVSASANQSISLGPGLVGGGSGSIINVSVNYGNTTGSITEGNDTRLSDARTPVIHAATHASGGADPVLLSFGDLTNVSSSTDVSLSGSSIIYDGLKWIPTSPGGTELLPIAYFVSASVFVTTTSTSDILIDDMTVTPAEGTYVAILTCTFGNSSKNSNTFINLYGANNRVIGSERYIDANQSDYRGAAASVGLIAVNGSQTIEGRWRVNGATGTIEERNMVLFAVQVA